MMDKTLERPGRRLLKGGDDEDIPSPEPFSHTPNNGDDDIAQDKSNEI
jgi:hypothetical protein